MQHIIVNTDEVAANLLKNGQLTRRTTILPLNKIRPKTIATDTWKAAERIAGKGNVFRAIDLIEYERDLEGAMAFEIGNILVCKDLDVANKVAFDKGVKNILCVTLQGDKVNPSGELSGGKKT